MKSTVEPITDAELAEVKRLHAAAYVVEPWTVEIEEYGNSGMVTITGLERILLDTDWADPEDFGVDQDRAHWIAGITNSFLPILARLEAAERELDERTTMAARAQEALRYVMNGLPTTDAVWAAYGNADSARAWLAARDSQQRREGAAKWLENAAREGGYYERSSEGMLEEAKQLREGGE